MTAMEPFDWTSMTRKDKTAAILPTWTVGQGNNCVMEQKKLPRSVPGHSLFSEGTFLDHVLHVGVFGGV